MADLHEFPSFERGWSIDRPHSYEVEVALLAALMAAPKTLEQCRYLTADDFYDALNADIYGAIIDLVDEGREPRGLVVAEHLNANEEMKRAIVKVATSAVSIINNAEYARLLRDLSRRRGLIQLAEEMLDGAIDRTRETDAEIELAEQGLIALDNSDGRRRIRSIGQAAAAAVDASVEAFKSGKPRGLETGLSDLDRIIGGMHGSDLLVLAGRPSMGKTGLALTIGHNLARSGKSVGFFSLEMSADELAERLLGDLSGFGHDRIRKGDLSEGEWAELDRARGYLDDIPLWIEETPGLSMPVIRTRAGHIQKRHGLDLIIIDHLHILRPAGKSRSRVEDVGEMSAAAKALAKDMDVPVLLLAQLSRAVEQRDDKRPQLSDLRWAGEIEQDADAVMFIYREEYYLGRTEPEDASEKADWLEEMQRVQNVAEIICAKNRHGPANRTARLFCELAYGRFRDLARNEEIF